MRRRPNHRRPEPTNHERNYCPREHWREVAVYNDPATGAIIKPPCDECGRAMDRRYRRQGCAVPKPEKHAHEWYEVRFRFVGRTATDRCRKCPKSRTVTLMHCPRCVVAGAMPKKDPDCFVCSGRGALRPPHACMCCGTGGLVAGAALCRECVWSHGYTGGVCDRESLHELRAAREAPPLPEGSARSVPSEAARKRAEGMQMKGGAVDDLLT